MTPVPEPVPAVWKKPWVWVRQQPLSRGYWTFFAAAFFFDAGFAVYFFLFNLYLLDLHFNERSMGWIGGALTAGLLVGTLPAGELARRIGLRPLLIFLFLAAPVLNSFRAIWMWEPAQIGLAFLAGTAMSCWGVCYLSAVARLTTEAGRTAGFSLLFSASVGASMVGGIVCGYLGPWLALAGVILPAAEIKRLILLGSCGLVLAGIIPVLQLHIPVPETGLSSAPGQRRRWRQAWRLSPFLRRFLPLMAFWSAVLAAFTPFANVYLSRILHISMTQIGLTFSAVQAAQFCLGLVAPVVFRRLGLIKGITVTEVAAAGLLFSLASTRNEGLAIPIYLAFSAAQWMSSPGLYNLLMDRTPDADRSAAAAMTLFCNSLISSVATAGAGILLTRFGYRPVLAGLALAGLVAALLFYGVLTPLDTAPLVEAETSAL